MGRVVCELLSTQIRGPKLYMNRILHYYGSHLQAPNECIISRSIDNTTKQS
jgi:hypothetical protein